MATHLLVQQCLYHMVGNLGTESPEVKLINWVSPLTHDPRRVQLQTSSRQRS
jgi:hypothetical protein